MWGLKNCGLCLKKAMTACLDFNVLCQGFMLVDTCCSRIFPKWWRNMERIYRALEGLELAKARFARLLAQLTLPRQCINWLWLIFISKNHSTETNGLSSFRPGWFILFITNSYVAIFPVGPDSGCIRESIFQRRNHFVLWCKMDFNVYFFYSSFVFSWTFEICWKPYNSGL